MLINSMGQNKSITFKCGRCEIVRDLLCGAGFEKETASYLVKSWKINAKNELRLTDEERRRITCEESTDLFVRRGGLGRFIRSSNLFVIDKEGFNRFVNETLSLYKERVSL